MPGVEGGIGPDDDVQQQGAPTRGGAGTVPAARPGAPATLGAAAPAGAPRPAAAPAGDLRGQGPWDPEHSAGQGRRDPTPGAHLATQPGAAGDPNASGSRTTGLGAEPGPPSRALAASAAGPPATRVEPALPANLTPRVTDAVLRAAPGRGGAPPQPDPRGAQRAAAPAAPDPDLAPPTHPRGGPGNPPEPSLLEQPSPELLGRAVTEALRRQGLLRADEPTDVLVGPDGAGSARAPRLRRTVVRTGAPRTGSRSAGDDPSGRTAVGPTQVHVHIDRVEVQRGAPAAPATPTTAPVPAGPSRLAAYLERRDPR